MAIFRRADDVQSTPVGDRLVLFHRATGASIVLNPSAAILWGALEHPSTAQELAGHLCRRHEGLSAERATEDVNRCLGQFVSQSIVTSDG
jgi:hypothetical protein